MVDGLSLGRMESVTSSENQRDHEGHKGDTGLTLFSTNVFVKKNHRDWPVWGMALILKRMTGFFETLQLVRP